MNHAAFEIRARMLELASEYCKTQYAAAEKLAWGAFGELVETGAAMQSEWIKYAPKMYDISEVVKKAEELNQFVKKRD